MVGVGWGGVVGEVKDKAISTQVVVEVGVELGNSITAPIIISLHYQ